MGEAENQINDLEYKETKNNQWEQQEEKRIQKKEDSISSLWDNFKYSNICIIGVPEEEKKREIGNLSEKTVRENFLNLVKEVQEAQRVPNKMDAKRPTPRHIIIKMPKVKDKERILKAAREKQLVTYSGVPIRLLADFSKETLQARRDWQEIFKVMTTGTYSQECSTQQSSHLDEGQIKSFLDKKPVLQEMLKGLL